MDDDVQDSAGFESRERVRAAARDARARARSLVQKTLSLKLTFEVLQAVAKRNVSQANELRDSLKCAVAQYTLAMQQLGEPPESVITLVKKTLDEGARDAFTGDPCADWPAARVLREDMVSWAIDSYYRIAS